MVRITEALIRKKSEHNEGIIGTLEELSLHQEDVEKIEHINNWCRDIQILYLQSNLISKIENLHKLKKLEYLNLAINNIEKVENLEGCESLEKLDLTLNFIGDLQSVCSLGRNKNLRTLYLIGNPCSDFQGYRNYVVAKLPQIDTLDGKEITRSEKIRACQIINQVEEQVKKAQAKYQAFRNEQRERLQEPNAELADEEFWHTASENAPETRCEIARRAKKHTQDEGDKSNDSTHSVRLFTKEGKPLNINQAKLKIKFSDEDPKEFVLEIAVYKYLDTTLIEVDVQPIYVTIKVKSKVLQYVLPEEVHTDKSTAVRSQTTGHLVIRMPRANYKEKICARATQKKIRETEKKDNRCEYLDVKPSSSMDFSKIIQEHRLEDLLVPPDLPPLEYC